MPRISEEPKSTKIHLSSRESIIKLVNPLSVYSRCESSAFVRQAINHAILKDLNQTDPRALLVPNSEMVDLVKGCQRSNDKIGVIETNEHINRAAIIASSSLKNARLFFEQAHKVIEEIQPILYYYGSLSFLEFVASSIIRRESVGPPGHGISISCGSDGWDFNKDWPKNQCWILSGKSGDFNFVVDALAIGGWPSLFSKSRLFRKSKNDVWQIVNNPSPLLVSDKMSLDLLCNFDQQKYLKDHGDVAEWVTGTDAAMLWKVTYLLMDFLVVFISSNLARYYIPAWRAIIDAEKSNIYNDIKHAYKAVSEDLPYYFEDEHPFQYSFGTRII